LALDGSEWSTSFSGHFAPGEKTLLPTEEEAGWAPELVWMQWQGEEIPAPTGNQALKKKATSVAFQRQIFICNKNIKVSQWSSHIHLIKIMARKNITLAFSLLPNVISVLVLKLLYLDQQLCDTLMQICRQSFSQYLLPCGSWEYFTTVYKFLILGPYLTLSACI
jgi:hypothetical protein